MISDITIGQFFPGVSMLHRLDPRVKLCMTLLLIVALFLAQNLIALLVVVGVILLGMAVSKVPARLYAKAMKPVLFIVLLTGVLNLFTGVGEPLVSVWIFKITSLGIRNCVFISIRVASLILASSLLTFTTSPTMLTDAIERLLSPLKKIRVPVHEFAMIMTIALRFVPTLLEETDKIMSAQKARGADLESGGIIQRVKALIPILIPLFVSAFRRAFDLGTAMESRCYHGGNGRTKMKILKLEGRDALVSAFGVVLVAAVVALNRLVLPVWL